MRDIAGKVALVTGASRGIGKATALALCKAGVRVVATARSEADLVALRDEAERSDGEIRIITGDATLEADVDRIVAGALDAFGSLDILVNNAGIGILGKLADAKTEDFDHQFSANVRSVFLFTRRSIPHLVTSRGNLVNIASISGLKGFAGASIYAASKFAVIGMSRSLDIELGPQGVKVTAICPAGVDTEWAIGTGLTREQVATIDRLHPDTIADAVLYAVRQPANARVTELIVYPMCEGGHQ